MDSVKTLVGLGARVKVIDNNDNNAAIFAATNRAEGAEIEAYLAQQGVDLDYPDKSRLTAFMWACFKGTTGTAEELLKLGVNVRATTAHGNSALVFAAQNLTGSGPGIIQIIGRYDPRQLEENGRSAFLVACKVGTLENVTTLVSLGAIDSTDSAEITRGKAMAAENQHYGPSILGYLERLER